MRLREVEVIRNQLLRNHVYLFGGTARFEDAHTVTVQGGARGDHTTVTAEHGGRAVPHARAAHLRGR